MDQTKEITTELVSYIDGTAIVLTLERQETHLPNGDPLKWNNLSIEAFETIEAFERSDETHSVKLSFNTVSSSEIDDLIENLKRIKYRLLDAEQE